MRGPNENQVERASATVAEIARTIGLDGGVVVFHPKGLGSPRWYPHDEFEAPLSEVWVPVPSASGLSDQELHTACRHKLDVALDYRQCELRRMQRELIAEGSEAAGQRVCALLYDELPAPRTV